MPKATTKSPLSGKLGAALKRNKGVPAKDTTFSRLPGGISNGVAKFTTVHRGEYKSGPQSGKPFVQLRGVVVSPKSALDTQEIWNKDTKKPEIISQNTVQILGSQTSIMFALCDTGKDDYARTEEENTDLLINQIKLLAGDNCFEENGIESEEDFWGFLEALTKAGIYFKFTTSSSKVSEEYPTQKVYENWGKAVDFEQAEEPDVEEDVKEDVEEEEEEVTEPEAEAVEEEGETEEDEIPFDENDLDALAEAADNDQNAEAAGKLEEFAEDAGIPKIKVQNAESWASVVEMIREKEGGGEAESPAEEEAEWEPTVGEVWFYKPKGKKKFTQHEVTAIFPGKKTCNLKDLTNPKNILRGCKWEDLKTTAEGAD